ncbi:hypothetical protein E2C01_046886 [Portunus trituberculatus]|uniref:Uncharacterized protein n=1 Tax=Portunus trituberculatus TaxID=210409 RepID=A0A5B7G8Z9_PORTR|nr:hypothetical protein [Portunus trituberculatus]
MGARTQLVVSYSPTDAPADSHNEPWAAESGAKLSNSSENRKNEHHMEAADTGRQHGEENTRWNTRESHLPTRPLNLHPGNLNDNSAFVFINAKAVALTKN